MPGPYTLSGDLGPTHFTGVELGPPGGFLPALVHCVTTRFDTGAPNGVDPHTPRLDTPRVSRSPDAVPRPPAVALGRAAWLGAVTP